MFLFMASSSWSKIAIFALISLKIIIISSLHVVYFFPVCFLSVSVDVWLSSFPGRKLDTP